MWLFEMDGWMDEAHAMFTSGKSKLLRRRRATVRTKGATGSWRKLFWKRKKKKCWAVYLRVIEAEVRRWGNWPPSHRAATAAAAKWVTGRHTAFMSHNHTHIHWRSPVKAQPWWMRRGYNALERQGVGGDEVYGGDCVLFSAFGLGSARLSRLLTEEPTPKQLVKQ